MSFESVDLIVQIDWALDLPMIDELIPPRRKVQKSIKKKKKKLFICSQFYPDNNCRNTDVGPYVWSLRVYRQLWVSMLDKMYESLLQWKKSIVDILSLLDSLYLKYYRWIEWIYEGLSSSFAHFLDSQIATYTSPSIKKIVLLKIQIFIAF